MSHHSYPLLAVFVLIISSSSSRIPPLIPVLFVGLVCSDRPEKIAHHKQPYAHPLPEACCDVLPASLLDCVELVKPTALIGNQGRRSNNNYHFYFCFKSLMYSIPVPIPNPIPCCIPIRRRLCPRRSF